MRVATWCLQMGTTEEEAQLALTATAREYGEIQAGQVLDITFNKTTWRVGVNFDNTFWAIRIPFEPRRKIEEELREVEFDIHMLENELRHPWDLADKAFLEQELEKLYNYRYKLKNS